MYMIGSSLFFATVWISVCDSTVDLHTPNSTWLCEKWKLSPIQGDISKWVSFPHTVILINLRKLKQCLNTMTCLNISYFQVLLMASFLFISLGYGLCKPNIAPFGADQIRGAGIETLQVTQSSNVPSLIYYSLN